MVQKYPCALAALFLLGAGLAQAEPRQQSGTAERLWVCNLGDQAAEVALDATGALGVRVEAGETVEAPELLAISGPAVFSKGAEALLIKTSGEFDPSTLEVDRKGRVHLERAGKRIHVRVNRPAWARELLGLAGSGNRIAAGETIEARAEAGADERVRLAVGLDKNSAVMVKVKEGRTVVRSFSVESSTPVRLRVDLGSTAEVGHARVELRVNRGTAFAAGASRLRSITAAATVGTAYFSTNILYFSGACHTFSVSGGPANTCGELNLDRNGNPESTGNWLCTDSSGNATKGPWCWQDKADDETGEPVFIRWPNGDTTTETFGIVDKESAVTVRDSASGAPPTAYSGHATDGQWGAGFDFGGDCFSLFLNTTPDPDQYWSPGTGSYNSTNAVFVPYSMSRVNRWYVNWSGSFPSSGSHVSTNSYHWITCCHDGYSGICADTLFTAQ